MRTEKWRQMKWGEEIETWRGKDVASMTLEELRDAFQDLGRLYNMHLHNVKNYYDYLKALKK